MDHPTESQLLAYAHGELGPEGVVAEHLRECAYCQQRLAALESLWAHLGAWTAPAPPPDLEGRILAALPARPDLRLRHALLGSLRIAAALLLAAGVGHVAGQMTWRPAPEVPGDATAAAAALHLDDTTTATMLLAALDAPEGGQP